MESAATVEPMERLVVPVRPSRCRVGVPDPLGGVVGCPPAAPGRVMTRVRYEVFLGGRLLKITDRLLVRTRPDCQAEDPGEDEGTYAWTAGAGGGLMSGRSPTTWLSRCSPRPVSSAPGR